MKKLRKINSRLLAGEALVVLCVASVVSSASAQLDHYNVDLSHTVRDGETLASISIKYYGDDTFERVLVTENGLSNHGGQSIVVGLRLTVPTVKYHSVKPGETWRTIAEKYYGIPDRGRVIARANKAENGALPDPGAELTIPYPLRHTAARGDTLKKIAKAYYGSSGPENLRDIRDFNRDSLRRIPRGKIILVPLVNLKLSESAQAELAVASGRGNDGPAARREVQRRVSELLPELAKLAERGDYVEVIAKGHEILGGGNLTETQYVRVQLLLAEGFVALRRHSLAVRSLREVLKHQPEFEYQPATASPHLRAALKAAKTRKKKKSNKKRVTKKRAGKK